MSLFEFLSSIKSTWKITIFVIVFCAWPLSAYLIFHHQTNYFLGLEFLKLTLLSSAIATPFMLLNSMSSYYLIHPDNPKLANIDNAEEGLAATILIGVSYTTIVLSVGSLLSLLDTTYIWVLGVMGLLEVAFLLLAGISVYQEWPAKTKLEE